MAGRPLLADVLIFVIAIVIVKVGPAGLLFQRHAHSHACVRAEGQCGSAPSRHRFVAAAAWMAGAVRWAAEAESCPRRRPGQPDQGRHRHRPHRADRLRRQRQRQRGQDGGGRHQCQGRGARAVAPALRRGHRVRRDGGGEQRSQAHPAGPGRRGLRRHHQLHAERHQGRHRHPGPDPYIYPQLYEGQECTPFIFCTGPTPAQQCDEFIPGSSRTGASGSPSRPPTTSGRSSSTSTRGRSWRPAGARWSSRSTIRSTRSNTAPPSTRS